MPDAIRITGGSLTAHPRRGAFRIAAAVVTAVVCIAASPACADDTAPAPPGSTLDAYVAALSPGDGGSPRLPPGGVEHLDEATAVAERTILGLRTARGLPLADAEQAPLADSFGWAIDEELLEVTDDARIVLTTRGRLLSNELFSRLV